MTDAAATRDALIAEAHRFGIAGVGLVDLLDVFDLRSCADTQARLAGVVTGECPCVTAASAEHNPSVPAPRLALALSALDGPATSEIVCTLDGGVDAMRERIGDWQAVLGQATGRHPADGGVALTFGHDPALAVELARLAMAEFACCSFFTFSLAVGPFGMRFTVTAPDEARDLVTAVFGTATPAPAGRAA